MSELFGQMPAGRRPSTSAHDGQPPRFTKVTCATADGCNCAPPDNPSVIGACACPVHGLHGQRNECYVCGEEVEIVAMVPAAERDALQERIDAAVEALSREGMPSVRNRTAQRILLGETHAEAERTGREFFGLAERERDEERGER